MKKRRNGLREYTCPICARRFIVPAMNAYWLYKKKNAQRIHFCSYSCWCAGLISRRYRRKYPRPYNKK